MIEIGLNKNIQIQMGLDCYVYSSRIIDRAKVRGERIKFKSIITGAAGRRGDILYLWMIARSSAISCMCVIVSVRDAAV